MLKDDLHWHQHNGSRKGCGYIIGTGVYIVHAHHERNNQPLLSTHSYFAERVRPCYVQTMTTPALGKPVCMMVAAKTAVLPWIRFIAQDWKGRYYNKRRANAFSILRLVGVVNMTKTPWFPLLQSV